MPATKASTPSTAPADGAAAPAAGAIKAVPVRRPGRWITGALCLLLGAALLHAVVYNPRFQWDVVGHYMTAGRILHGLLTTLELTVIAMVIGIVLGVVLAVMRLSDNPIARAAAWLYIGFFRGTPVLVQLIFWFNLSALFPHIALGVPDGPDLLLIDVNVLITPFAAAILGLGLNQGAYMSEIVRSGIVSIPHGQRQAAAALGLSRRHTMRRIILPQAMRVIIPPTGNETVGMLKMTSIVSVVALSELLYSAQSIYTMTYETIPLLIVVSFWYVVITTILTIGQTFIERHYSRGATPGQAPSIGQRFRRNLSPLRSRISRSAT
ncbi:amino acid ABC transporter permease [Streptomyces sp. NPDC056637]|uniref:amino acid ABC transporter permease n=1 Tax=unclassified Streptomyces TaxID=2593676 RepID=UPI0036574D96